MGRKPIARKPMSPAERKARSRAKAKAAVRATALDAPVRSALKALTNACRRKDDLELFEILREITHRLRGISRLNEQREWGTK